MGILYFIIALSILIAIHEFGHFICAKLFNVYVYEFSLFMGPKLFQFKKGETKYSLRLLPIGGYCSMAGELDLQAERNEQEERARKDNPGKEVEEIPEIPPERTLSGVAAWKKLIISSAGAIMNILLCFVLLVLYYGVQGIPHEDTRVVFVAKNSLFADAGVESGDKLLSGSTTLTVTLVENNEVKTYTVDTMDFETLNSVNEMDSKVIQAMKDDIINPDAADKFGIVDKMSQVSTFLIENQDGTTETINVTREYTKTYEDYITSFSYASYGIMAGFRQGNFGEVLSAAFYEEINLGTQIYVSLWDLITGKESFENMSGIVGIASMSNTIVNDIGFMYFVWFVAFISVNLGIMNLLPLPALDGGRNILTIYEMITRKKVNPKVEGIINSVGFILLMVLMVVITVMDIIRL